MSKRQTETVTKPKKAATPQKVPPAVPDSIKWLGYFYVPFEGP